MNTIRSRILCSFLLVGVIVLGVVGFVSYSVSKNALVNAARMEGQAIAGKLRESFEQYMGARVAFMQSVAGHEAMRNPEWEKNREFLSSLDASGLQIQAFFFIQPNGDALYLDGRVGKLGDRAYFREAFATGKTVVGNPLLSRATGEMVVIVASPVFSADKKVRGVLCGRIVANTFLSLAERQKWGESGYAVVVDSSGLIVVHPDKESIGVGNLVKNDGEKKYPSGMSEAFVSALKGNSSVAEFSEEGKEYIMAYSSVPLTGWGVAVASPVDEFLDPVLRVRNMILLLSVVVFLLIAAVSAWIARSLSKPVSGIVNTISVIASGDFSSAGTPETGGLQEIRDLSQALGHMVSSLGNLIRDVAGSSSILADNADKISDALLRNASSEEKLTAAFASVRAAAGETACAIESTNGAIEEMAAGAESGARSASDAGSRAEEAAAAVNDGNTSLLEVMSSVRRVSETNVGVGNAMADLNSSVEKISGFVDTITSIADQTNLLALNAAIEAARAGEAGRGFAVVADEVRKLAESSATAAKDIETVISTIVEKTKNAVSDNEHISSEIALLSEKAAETGKKIGNAAAAMGAVSENVQSIAAAAEEQSASIQEITSNMEKLTVSGNEVASQIDDSHRAIAEQSDIASELSSMAKDLVSLAGKLKGHTGRFRI